MRRLALIALAAFGLAACGPPPPQAPLHFAKKLDEATGSISTACGEAFQLTAFPGGAPKEWVTLEATATTAAEKLAYVYDHGEGWIYQGETVHQIVHDSASMLDSCGLRAALAVLHHKTHTK